MAGPHQPFGLPDSDLPHQTYMYVCMYVCIYDDSFDPRPIKHRNEITLNQLEFAQKLRKIDPLPAAKTSDENDDSQKSEYNISHLSIMSQAKKYIEANVDNTSESNLFDVAEQFL